MAPNRATGTHCRRCASILLLALIVAGSARIAYSGTPMLSHGTRLPWHGVSALSPADRAFAGMIGQEIRAQFADVDLPPDAKAFYSTPIAAATVAVSHGALLFLKFNSSGNCADFNFYVFGPRNRWGLRRPLLYGLCVGQVRIDRSGSGMPSLVLPLATMVAVLPWEGHGWKNPTKLIIQDFDAMHGGR